MMFLESKLEVTCLYW